MADKKNHGGPEKAVFAYPIQHYTYWKEDLKLEAIDAGAMGENLAVLEMDESSLASGISTNLEMPSSKYLNQDDLAGNRRENSK